MHEFRLRQIYKNKVFNYRPSWILRWGITLFLSFLLLIIVATEFLKYPDIVPAEVEITTLNPPVNLVARVNGKIEDVFVHEGDLVSDSDVLAVLESSAEWEDMKILNQYVNILDSIVYDSIQRPIPNPSLFNDKLHLGEVQNSFVEVLTNYAELFRFFNSGIFEKEYKSLYNRRISQEEYLGKLIMKKDLFIQQLKLAETKYGRDSLIFSKDVISRSDYELSYQKMLQYKSLLADVEINIVNGSSALNQLKYDLQKMNLKYTANKQQLVVRLVQNIRLLKSKIDFWEQNYLIVSPIQGIASFTDYWSRNQNVRVGDVVVSVVPADSTCVKVRLRFPIQNSGKVKEGQRVNIKLHNYPYQEFGMVVGRLSAISKIPNDLFYSADVVLEHGLITSYGEKLPRFQQLKGNAEILTDDLSLLRRFFHPLKAFMDEKL